MERPTLSYYIHGKAGGRTAKKTPGPFVTISREPGCEGYKVGDLLLEMLNKADPQKRWRVLKKEILHQLAQEAELSEDAIERELYAARSILKEFFRGMSRGGIPDGYEIRSKITAMARAAATTGYAIIIGQGGAAATGDIANGLSIRIEAPQNWRMIRICRRDKISKEEALAQMAQEERKRMRLRKLYEKSNLRKPPYDLMFDNSALDAQQIASIVYHAMQMKKMTP